jgi:hypothetical protein
VQVETPKKLGKEERQLLQRLGELRADASGDGPGALRHPGTVPPPAGMR